MYHIIAKATGRIANRIYIGTEFCMFPGHPLQATSEAYPKLGRNEEFLTCATDYAQAVVLCAEVLRVFPEWMKGY